MAEYRSTNKPFPVGETLYSTVHDNGISYEWVLRSNSNVRRTVTIDELIEGGYMIRVGAADYRAELFAALDKLATEVGVVKDLGTIDQRKQAVQKVVNALFPKDRDERATERRITQA